MSRIICVGVDPAPSWGGAVAECIYKGGKFGCFQLHKKKKHGELRTRLTELANLSSEEYAIVGWDAPLTGPPKPDDETNSLCKGQLSDRGIEKALRRIVVRKRTEVKKQTGVKGVSVRPFGGCSHWTITRNLVGLPRVGKWDRQEKCLPFHLLTEDALLSKKSYIVEVHPAVALWLWVSEDNLELQRDESYFIYKGGSKKQEDQLKRRGEILDRVFKHWENNEATVRFMDDLDLKLETHRKLIIESGDSLDAFIAMALVCLFVRSRTMQPDQRPVKLFGDRERGAMLLPDHKELSVELRRAH